MRASWAYFAVQLEFGYKENYVKTSRCHAISVRFRIFLALLQILKTIIPNFPFPFGALKALFKFSVAAATWIRAKWMPGSFGKSGTACYYTLNQMTISLEEAFNVKSTFRGRGCHSDVVQFFWGWTKIGGDRKLFSTLFSRFLDFWSKVQICYD